MHWIDTFAFDNNGNLVFTSNKLDLFFTSTMVYDGSTGDNFRILSLPINANSYIYGEPAPQTERPPTASAGLSLSHAKGLIESAVNYITANDTGVASNVVVIDAAGHVKASLRMEGAINLVDTFAIQKAKTALMVAAEYSGYLSSLFYPGQALFHVDEILDITNIGGAAPIFINGVLSGAIGVSGAPTAQQDVNAALHAAHNYVPTTQIVLESPTPRLTDTITRLQVAEAKATALKTRQSITITDDLGRTVGFYRMDGAGLISYHLSRKKAVSAILTELPLSSSLGSLLQPSGSSFTADYSNNLDIVGLGGGMLFKNGGDIVGSIGLSGSSDSNVDQAVTQAAYDAIAPANLRPTPSITLGQAYAILQSTLDAASKARALATVCVADALGEVKLLYSPEGSSPGSVEQACKKAYTAATLPLPAAYFPGLLRPGQSTYYNIGNGAKGLVAYSGLVALSNKDGAVIGGVGVHHQWKRRGQHLGCHGCERARIFHGSQELPRPSDKCQEHLLRSEPHSDKCAAQSVPGRPLAKRKHQVCVHRA